MKGIFVAILVMVFISSIGMAAAQTSAGPYGTERSGSGKPSGEPARDGMSGDPARSGSPGIGPSRSGASSSEQPYRGGPTASGQSTDALGRPHGAAVEDYKASNWIGAKLQNPQGETLGKIEDLVLNPGGQVDFVIVTHGGGILRPGRYTAVPFASFSRKDEKTLMLDISKERLAEAPSFERNSWPDMTDRKWSEDVYRYYGQKPYWSEPSSSSPSEMRDFSGTGRERSSSGTEPERKRMD